MFSSVNRFTNKRGYYSGYTYFIFETAEKLASVPFRAHPKNLTTFDAWPSLSSITCSGSMGIISAPLYKTGHPFEMAAKVSWILE